MKVMNAILPGIESTGASDVLKTFPKYFENFSVETVADIKISFRCERFAMALITNAKAKSLSKPRS
jgi:hypothetical protein